MKYLLSIIFFYLLLSCGAQNEEVILEEEIVRNTFGVVFFREVDSPDRWIRTDGALRMRFVFNRDNTDDTPEKVELDYDSFADIFGRTCTGRVDYTLSETTLDIAEEGSYDIFSRYTPPEEFVREDITTDEQGFEVFERDITVNLTRDELNTDCPITTFETNRFFIRLFVNGDLLYRDLQRGYEYFMRPLQ